MANICVYCSSSTRIDSRYTDVAETLGRNLATRDHTLVYGGGDIGLMGALARTVRDDGGRVVGVIPEKLKEKENIAYDLADELIVTDTMNERKRIMYLRADAFIVLPGGFGTIEEFMEVLTLKQLAYHERPIALVNTNGFFDPLLDFFRQLYEDAFTRTKHEELVRVTQDPKAALTHVEHHAASPASKTLE